MQSHRSDVPSGTMSRAAAAFPAVIARWHNACRSTPGRPDLGAANPVLFQSYLLFCPVPPELAQESWCARRRARMKPFTRSLYRGLGAGLGSTSAAAGRFRGACFGAIAGTRCPASWLLEVASARTREYTGEFVVSSCELVTSTLRICHIHAADSSLPRCGKETTV